MRIGGPRNVNDVDDRVTISSAVILKKSLIIRRYDRFPVLQEIMGTLNEAYWKNGTCEEHTSLGEWQMRIYP